MNDLTVVFYTANSLPAKFAEKTLKQLQKASEGLPFIRIDKDPMVPASHIGIYRQALYGAKQSKTRYIALCEDDVLYSPEHFKYQPSPGLFAYNLSAWSIFTWGEPIFTHKGKVRQNLNSLICERDLFIEAMEERFRKHPDESRIDIKIWAEPGRYERYLGVTERPTEAFYTNPPNVIFTHENELSFRGLGTKKRLGEYRAIEIPYWGSAKKVKEIYK